MKATDETAIQPQGQQARRTMRGLALTDIPKSGQKRRADHIAVAQDRRPRRQDGGDPAQLQTVQHLPMRQMDIGDGEAVKFQKLADAPDDDAPLQGQILRRPMKRMRTPGGKPVIAPRQGAARIMSAELLRHAVDLSRHLLHQQQVRPMLTNQLLNMLDLRAPRMPQIPADDFHSIDRFRHPNARAARLS